jgi:AraC-like DNA-binding protein
MPQLKKEISKSGPTSALVRQVRQYLDANFEHPFSIATLADSLGLSSSHLQHRFSQEMGEPPMAYLIRLRVEKAKQLLRRGLPIKQVAGETGFYDSSHLARHFKRLVGQTPAKYAEIADGARHGT